MTIPSLNAQFAALHAERERSWPAEQLQRNVAQRAALVAGHDGTPHAQAGDIVASFSLIDTDGRVLDRDTLLANGPAVLIFFRFAGCPACNIALPHYDRLLGPTLARAGIPLVAVSPQTPADPAIVARHGLSLTVASDADNALGDRLGITFEADTPRTLQPGESWIGATTGSNSWRLPKPTVLVIDRDARIRFIDISPDWLKRTEVDAVLAALPELRAEAAAA